MPLGTADFRSPKSQLRPCLTALLQVHSAEWDDCGIVPWVWRCLVVSYTSKKQRTILSAKMCVVWARGALIQVSKTGHEHKCWNVKFLLSSTLAMGFNLCFFSPRKTSKNVRRHFSRTSATGNHTYESKVDATCCFISQQSHQESFNVIWSHCKTSKLTEKNL